MKVFASILFSVVACTAIQSSNSENTHHRVTRQAYAAAQPSYDLPANYDFEWRVKDDYSKNDFGHQESRKDQQTSGSYHVALPDGRIQTVTYSVDGYGGYVAEVSYNGQAVYPEVRPYSNPAPAPYQPLPAPVPVAAPVPLPTSAPYRPVALPPPQPTAAPFVSAPYRPQPAPYRPQPIQPYAAASSQSATYSLPPSAPAAAPSVRRYTFKTAAESAPVVDAIQEESAIISESAPAPLVDLAEPRSAPVDESFEIAQPEETTVGFAQPIEEATGAPTSYYFRH